MMKDNNYLKVNIGGQYTKLLDIAILLKELCGDSSLGRGCVQ